MSSVEIATRLKLSRELAESRAEIHQLRMKRRCPASSAPHTPRAVSSPASNMPNSRNRAHLPPRSSASAWPPQSTELRIPAHYIRNNPRHTIPTTHPPSYAQWSEGILRGPERVYGQPLGCSSAPAREHMIQRGDAWHSQRTVCGSKGKYSFHLPPREKIANQEQQRAMPDGVRSPAPRQSEILSLERAGIQALGVRGSSAEQVWEEPMEEAVRGGLQFVSRATFSANKLSDADADADTLVLALRRKEQECEALRLRLEYGPRTRLVDTEVLDDEFLLSDVDSRLTMEFHLNQERTRELEKMIQKQETAAAEWEEQRLEEKKSWQRRERELLDALDNTRGTLVTTVDRLAEVRKTCDAETAALRSTLEKKEREWAAENDHLWGLLMAQCCAVECRLRR